MKKYFTLFSLFIVSFVIFSQDSNIQIKEPRSSSVIIQELRDNMKHQKEIIQLKDIIIKLDAEKIELLQSNAEKITVELQESIENEEKFKETIIRQEEQLKRQNKWLKFFSIFFFMLIIVHFIIVLIKAKWKITLPYWLNSIL